MATPLRDMAVRRSGQAAPARSLYRQYAPSSAEAASVALSTWVGIAGWARGLRLFPDGCVDLVWNGSELLAVGPTEAAFVGRLRAGTVNVGVRLRPESAGAVLGFPAWRLRRGRLRLRDVWSSQGADAEARLARTAPGDEQRRMLQAIVAERASGVQAPEPVVRAAVRQLEAGARHIGDLAGHLSIGERDLRRLFGDEVGLSPKALHRVFRFQRLLQRLPDLAAGRVGAAAMAVDLDYADQAHMTRECRRIAGVSPVALAKRQAA
jgi:AraC-like DNA-binding protein